MRSITDWTIWMVRARDQSKCCIFENQKHIFKWQLLSHKHGRDPPFSIMLNHLMFMISMPGFFKSKTF